MSHFKLPEWRELSRDEQIEIINLPTDRTYFVRGGPGTGKSILAVHRVARLRDLELNTSVKLLVYNKALQLHLRNALATVKLKSAIAQTCHSWLLHMTGLGRQQGLWNYDWEEVRRRVIKKTQGRKIIGHLIIDEAQDIPRPLLKILHEVSSNATIFVDPNQAMNHDEKTQEFCQLAGIRAVFEQGPDRTYHLTKNFRNSQQILNAAYALRPLRRDERPDQAIRTDGPKPVLRRASIEEVAQRLETYYVNNPADRIAVAVPDNRDWEVYKELSKYEVPIQLYKNAHAYDGSYNPEAKGATVLAYKVTKGLEFDAVFMPFLDDPYFHASESPELLENLQNIVYVVSTRARTFLEFSHDGDLPPSWLSAALDKACAAGGIRRV